MSDQPPFTIPLFEPVTSPEVHAQWRLAEVQLANWGTFDGAIYRIPIARKGHLVTGPSGSGKSSFLDAIAAVLTPDKWLRFNQAAQGGGVRTDQRSIVSYVRGAWSRVADEDEDRVVSQFLRPGATWSGIILRYENDIDAPVSLCRLFFAKGTVTRSADINDLCMLVRAAIDLREIEPFARNGLETRKVKAQWPDAVVTSGGSHARFYGRMRALLGIADESALQLLHKTQSAKTLDSLDQLLREYMLERPSTFALADTAQEQFGELRDAHEHVVQLRDQRDHLAQLRIASTTYDQAHAVAQATSTLADAVVPHQKHRSLDLARTERATCEERLTALASDVAQADAAHQSAEDDYALAQRRALELGGSEVDHLRREIRTAENAAHETADRWQRLKRQLENVGIVHTPASAAEYAELQAEITRTLTSHDAASGASHDEQKRFFDAKDAVTRIETELTSLRLSGTAVPSALLEQRQLIAENTRLPVSALPFAAELVEVRPEYAEWSGAIERVLRPLALTLLVRSEHLRAVRRWVDAHQINARLVFEEVSPDTPPPRPTRSDRSLIHRLTVSAGPFGEWMSGVLSDRFDYACVDGPDELDKYTKAITINGQVKSSRTRYEKDDRTRIDDRTRWVLGDREAKREALVTELKRAERERDSARAVVDAADEKHRSALMRAGTLKAIGEQAWSDVNRDAATTTVSQLQSRLAELTRDDHGLSTALDVANAAQVARDAAGQVRETARLAQMQARSALDDLTEVVRDLEAVIASGAVPPVDETTTAALDTRFHAIQRSITRHTIAEVGQQVYQKLQQERDRALATANTAGNDIARFATQFNERWPTASADLIPSIADRRGYLDILDQIITHGLPEHEARFLTLLRERSRDMIGELVSDILATPREIEERVIPVNTSLARSPFDEGRYLRLRVKQRRSETVTQFIADLRSISAGGWADDDAETAERRFSTLAEIMRRFASSDHIDRSWKTQCLDTRLHVTFLAEEVDAHGRVHATYDSGAAMSGGQQQKLVVFCLAAALRYQLADTDESFSRYGTIVLDEAFDKADTRYTRMALDVFVEFGFHLVLATPQKLLQTIEPYVGAATSIENPTRRRSVVASVPWHETAPR